MGHEVGPMHEAVDDEVVCEVAGEVGVAHAGLAGGVDQVHFPEGGFELDGGEDCQCAAQTVSGYIYGWIAVFGLEEGHLVVYMVRHHFVGIVESLVDFAAIAPRI